MIDMHSHILPGIDDGAKTPEESIAMAKAALADGITTIVATPHHKNNYFNNHKAAIIEHVATLNDLLLQRDIPLTVLPGQEVRIYGEVMEDMAAGEILPVNHSKYVMIEFARTSVPRYAAQLFYDMQVAGYIPVIVHPERNDVFRNNHRKIYEFVQKGALTQITAGSLLGKFGKETQTFTHQLIEANLTHLVASDAHNTTTRGFCMKAAYDEIHSLYGMDKHYMFLENAQLLVDNMNLHQYEPSMIKQKKRFLGLF